MHHIPKTVENTGNHKGRGKTTEKCGYTQGNPAKKDKPHRAPAACYSTENKQAAKGLSEK